MASAISGAISALWGALLKFLSGVAQFFVDVIVLIANTLVDAFFWVIIFASSLLPNVPDLPGSTSFSTAILGMANYFFPVQELFQAMVFLGFCWGIRGVILLARFIRGGG